MTGTRLGRVALGLVWAVAAFVAVGCGGPATSDVLGTVTLKGKAPNLPGLTINFFGADGRVATAAVAPDGSYRATGVPAGDVRVGFALLQDEPQEPDSINKPRPGESPEDFERRRANLRAAKSAKGKKLALGPTIPELYLDPLKSGVTTALKPGPGNTFDVDIK